MKYKITKEDLLLKLQDQLSKIEIFCELYDNGEKHIVEEIAVKLRVIFHNTDMSKSLLKQLKLEHIEFVDSALRYCSENLVTHLGLVSIKFISNGTSEYIPFLNDYNRNNLVDFKNWWENKKVIVDLNKKKFTRKKIINEIANTDGGAHIDSHLKEDYYNLSRRNSSGVFVSKNGIDTSIGNPILASIRQIAHEILLTFRRIDISKESKLR